MRRPPARRRVRPFVGLATLLFLSGTVIAASRQRELPGGRGLVFESERWDATAADPRQLAVADVGNLRFTLSNAGAFGDAFGRRELSSMEWPARSGIDHLVRGGLWIGAISAATGDTLVTIGSRDGQYTEDSYAHSEFTPISAEPPIERSRLRTSPNYQDSIVSDENFHTVYVDTLPIVKLSGEEKHTPMGIRVTQETYTWSFDPVDDFLICEINILNTGSALLEDVWVGIYSELVTNDRQANWPAWPPGGRWFDFQDPHYDPARHLLWNHNVEHRFVSDDLRGGIQVIGTGGRGPYGRGPDSLSTKRLTLSAWNWNPGQFQRWTDDSLYVRMNTGQVANLDSLFDPNTEDNPVSVLSVGPFDLRPDSTLQVVFAFIGAENQADLERNSFWAQKAYDDAYALPSPPSPPILRVYPRHQELVLRWSSEPESEIDPASHLADFQGYRVYLSEQPEASGYRLVHQYDVRDGVGFDSGLDAVRLPAPYIDGPDTLEYELVLGGIPDGFKRYVAMTSYDYQIPDPQSLENGVLSNSIYCTAGPDAAEARGRRVSVFPNPYRGESALDGRDSQGQVNPRQRVLWFTNLPPRARLRIYTLAGDLVREYDYDAATYRGTEAAGVAPDPSDVEEGKYLVTGGSMLAFDLLSENRQEIASGLYLFSVEDRTTGETQQGKFLVLK